jgi:hypothetical protein
MRSHKEKAMNNQTDEEIIDAVGDAVGIAKGGWDTVSDADLVAGFRSVLGQRAPISDAEIGKIDALITAVVNASFDCGEWNGKDREEYDDILQQSIHARTVLRDAVISLSAKGDAPTQPTPRPTDDELWDQTLKERDDAQEMADDIAAQIAAITGVEIGEHSNLNEPWRNAMLAADDFIANQLRELVAPKTSPEVIVTAAFNELKDRLQGIMCYDDASSTYIIPAAEFLDSINVIQDKVKTSQPVQPTPENVVSAALDRAAKYVGGHALLASGIRALDHAAIIQAAKEMK